MLSSLRPSAKIGAAIMAARVAVCGLALFGSCASARAAAEPPHSAELDAMIIAQAKRHGVPEKLVRRIVMRESKYNPRARNHAYWGLMQISYPTAKSMGFKGTPEQLLNPLVNLTYAVPYLANAFIIAGKQEDAAVRLYAAGYYFTARSRGLLNELRTAASDPVRGSGQPADQPPIMAAYESTPAGIAPVAVASAAPAPVSTMGKDSGEGVAMVADRRGDMTPPKKWLHDGGTTTIARGEQRIEQVAAYAKTNDDAAATAPARHAHARKVLAFASLDTPAEAQAYAAQAAQDPRLAQADSQAAIAQVTSGPPGRTRGACHRRGASPEKARQIRAETREAERWDDGGRKGRSLRRRLPRHGQSKEAHGVAQEGSGSRLAPTTGRAGPGAASPGSTLTLDMKRAPREALFFRADIPTYGQAACWVSTTLGPRFLPIGIWRGFWASGTSRTRST